MANNVTNVSCNSSVIDEASFWYYDHKSLFWMLISISIIIALAGAIGNALVIYASTRARHMKDGFRYLNDAVKSLAVTDFCLSVFGTPFSVVYWYWGKINLSIIFKHK